MSLAAWITQLWYRLFLVERPSVSLSAFRIAAAVTVGCHVLPSFVPLKDTYLSGAFKTYNTHFFPVEFIRLVQKSPDAMVMAFVALFTLSWFAFLIGWRTQISCAVMFLSCYYFYALNAFHIGTLSWDILLVTLFLLCLTPYPGDYFSLDALRRRDPGAWHRKKPFFIQRLLQMQIAFTFFYTALYKVTAEGNWITGNPIYYLMNRPVPDVTKQFMFKDFFAARPDWCYLVGLAIVTVEFLMPFLLFIPRTRRSAIYMGCFFHVLLILTLDVPAIFFFLFPAQLLLFINPDLVTEGIRRRRHVNERSPRFTVVYDGECGFCRDSVLKLKVMDLSARLTYVDFRTHPDLTALHPELTRAKAERRLYLILPDGRLLGGYFAFQRLSLVLPMMMPLAPLMYAPGADLAGPPAYAWVADHRYLFSGWKKRTKTCRSGGCDV